MASIAPGARERKKAQTRTAFMQTAANLFAERGYDAVTVEDICAAVDVSPRTFFRYFATKADLVLASVTDVLGELLEDLRGRPADEPAWPALSAMVLAAADRITEQKQQFLPLVEVIRAAPELVGSNAAVFDEWEREMTAETARRLPDAAAKHARLLTGVALTAFRVGIDEWAVGGGKGSARTPLEINLELVAQVGTRVTQKGTAPSRTRSRG